MRIVSRKVKAHEVFTAPYDVTMSPANEHRHVRVMYTDDPGQPSRNYVVLETDEDFEGAVQLLSTLNTGTVHSYHLCSVLVHVVEGEDENSG